MKIGIIGKKILGWKISAKNFKLESVKKIEISEDEMLRWHAEK